MGRYTYTLGPVVVFHRAFTTNDVVRLCDELTASFGPGHVFDPEAITEGGIIMRAWPGKARGQYKTFRFSLRGTPVLWPLIDEGTLDRWRLLPPKVVYSKGLQPLFLKAFHGAPCWTTEELRILRGCFERIGFRVRGRPRGSGRLVQVGELGDPRPVE